MLSVIVPVRNEKANMEQLLNSLSNQNYPKHLIEIIISDDHSTDDTVIIAHRFFEKLLKISTGKYQTRRARNRHFGGKA